MFTSAQKKQHREQVAVNQQQQQENVQQAMQQQEKPLSKKEQGKKNMRDYIAANENLYADEKQDKHGNSTLEVARMSKEAVHGQGAEQRRDAFHQQLAFNCELDQKQTHGRSCQQALSAVHQFTSMNLNQTSHIAQGEALAQARKELEAGIKELKRISEKQQEIQSQIRELSLQFGETQDQALIPQIEALSREMEALFAHESNLKQEREVLERYQLYFDTMTNGRLEVPKDDEVPPGWKLTRDPHLIPQGLEWKNVRDEPLFTHEFSLEDIKQGGVGDCYMEAALANMIATNPEKLKECIVDNGDGTVTVRFYKSEDIEDVPEMEAACRSKHWDGLNGMQLMTKIAHLLCDETGSTDGVKSIYMMKGSAGIGNTQDVEASLRTMARSSLMNIISPAMQHPMEMQQLLQELSEEPAMQTFLNDVQEYIHDNPNLEAADFDVLENIMQKFSDNISFDEMNKIAEKYNPRITQITQKPREVHPVYVTVTKEIPVIKGMDRTYYSHGSLATKLIQKAYAASGLHLKNRQLKDFFAKHIEEVIDLKHLPTDDREKEALFLRARLKLMEKYYPTYESTAGGHSSEFLNELFNEKNTKIKEENAIWTNLKKNRANISNGANEIYGKEDFQFVNKNTRLSREDVQQTYTEITNNVLRRLTEKIDDRKDKDTRKNRAFLAHHELPMTIEDFQEKLRTIKEWGPGSDAYRQIMEGVRRLAPENASKKEMKELFDQVMEKVMEATTRVFEEGGAGMIVHHKMFATKMVDGKEVALYTPHALKRYQAIQEALEKKIPVGVGTREYGLKDNGNGLNGESVVNGLAENHAYSVIGCKEIDGHKFVVLRNPWANTIRNYRIRLKPDPNGGPPIKEYKADFFDTQDTQEGQFMMELNDFMIRMDDFYGINA